MAKRAGESFANNSKRQKISDIDETFWEDDIDDDCLDVVAARALEQDYVASTQPSQGNASILPSYDHFRPNIPFASTQNTPISTPVPTFNEPQIPRRDRKGEIFEELQMKVTYLQQKCEAKEGEVTILRTQMQKMKTEMIEDQSKKHKEYLEISNLKEKEIKSIKGQLEFKNLEIANLKQKISEVSKATVNYENNNKRQRLEDTVISTRKTNSSMMSTLLKDSPRKVCRHKETEVDIETNILQEPEFPLLSKFSTNFFEAASPEVYVVETRINHHGRNTIPYLHNQMAQEEFTISSGPKVTVKIDKKDVSLEYIYPDMFKLIQSNADEINYEENKPVINKILCMSIQLLEYFKQYLELLEKSYRTEDIEQLDKTFLQSNAFQGSSELNNNRNNLDCGIGVRAAKTVEFLAELLPYSTHLTNYVLYSKSIEFTEDLLNTFTFGKSDGKNDYYLLLLNDITRKIFYLRKTEICHSFLNAVGTLLLNVSKDDLYTDIFPIFSSLIGSLLFTRPPANVLHKLLIVIKNCSRSKNFVEFLCRKPSSIKFTTDKKRQLHYFMEESCKFTLFVTLLEISFRDVQDDNLYLDIAANVLSFIHNIFTMNPFWMHDQQKDQCICLEQLYRLAIEILYKTLLRFKRNRYTTLKETYVLIFKCGIKVLHLLTFNSYDLMEKYMENYSWYREICNSLLEVRNDFNYPEELDDLEKLNIFDEVPNLESANFELL